MLPIVHRLFLALLLAIDWAADPSLLAPGLEVLAAPLASTECYCYSLKQRDEIRKVAGTAQGEHEARQPGCHRRHLPRPDPRPRKPPQTVRAVRLVYLLLFLRR
jgi:hypothetical protein